MWEPTGCSESGYFRAKIAQEKLITESSIPYSIVHATQFFEFLKGLADISMVGDKVHLPPVLFQPMAADDVASWRRQDRSGAAGKWHRGNWRARNNFAWMNWSGGAWLSLKDPREVVADPNARYAGAKLSEKTLVPGNNARLGDTRFEIWLTQPAAQLPSARPQAASVAAVSKEAVSKEKDSHKKAS